MGATQVSCSSNHYLHLYCIQGVSKSCNQAICRTRQATRFFLTKSKYTDMIFHYTGKLCHVPLDVTVSSARVVRGAADLGCQLRPRKHCTSHCQLHLHDITLKWWITLGQVADSVVTIWFRPELPQCMKTSSSSSSHFGRCHCSNKWYMPLLSWVAYFPCALVIVCTNLIQPLTHYCNVS